MVRVVGVVATTPERHGKVESEAVDVTLLNPVAQGVQDEQDDHRMAQVDGIAAPRHVDVTASVVEAVVDAVVQPSQ